MNICKMILNKVKISLVFGAVLLCAASCVYVDDRLGQNFIPDNQIYDISMAEFKLNDIKMGFADSLSAYSSTRITVGAIRDEMFGLTKRSSAFTIVPVSDSIDVGIDPVVTQFHLTAVRDTTSIPYRSQLDILQNINVYSLTKTLDTTYIYAWDDRYDTFYDSSVKIAKGAPVYAGGDSLSFDFTDEYAQRYLDAFKENPGIQMDLDAYLEKLPGIYLTVDDPVGMGGRINMFGCALEFNDYYYVTANFAELKLKTKYTQTDEPHDTSFLFYFGPVERIDDITSTEQYAFNICEHESKNMFPVDETGFVPVTGDIYVESGAGLKPVVSAQELKDLVTAELVENGFDPGEVIINKATIVLPYQEPTDYDLYYTVPLILSPTCKLSYSTTWMKEDGTYQRYVTYGGLTDASISDEDQGDINRSLTLYSPDISHHVQTILNTPDDTLATGKYDVWLLIMSYEEQKGENNSTYDELSEYYQYMAYSSYYSSMYGGSYSGSYYSNYYNYLMYAEYYASLNDVTYTTPTLDKDKYFEVVLNGPTSADGPKFKITYSYIKRDEDE